MLLATHVIFQHSAWIKKSGVECRSTVFLFSNSTNHIYFSSYLFHQFLSFPCSHHLNHHQQSGRLKITNKRPDKVCASIWIYFQSRLDLWSIVSWDLSYTFQCQIQNFTTSKNVSLWNSESCMD